MNLRRLLAAMFTIALMLGASGLVEAILKPQWRPNWL